MKKKKISLALTIMLMMAGSALSPNSAMAQEDTINGSGFYWFEYCWRFNGPMIGGQCLMFGGNCLRWTLCS